MAQSISLETPGDKEVGGRSRQVPNACWSRVLPTPSPNLEAMLVVRRGRRRFGTGPRRRRCSRWWKASGRAWTHMLKRYGGHQFGNWAGQLGDGRAITLGEVQTKNGVWNCNSKVLVKRHIQDIQMAKQCSDLQFREFLCSEAMFHLGVLTTRALSLVTTGEQVMRDILYNGNKQLEPGAMFVGLLPVSFA